MNDNQRAYVKYLCDTGTDPAIISEVVRGYQDAEFHTRNVALERTECREREADFRARRRAFRRQSYPSQLSMQEIIIELEKQQQKAPGGNRRL